MGVTQFSLRNPLVVAGLAVALCLFGVFAFSSLGVAITPNVNIPSVVVTTTYPGADPETVETTVTKPIEDAIAGLPNIDTNGLSSISSAGVSTVTVNFTTSANADLVPVDVQRVVNAVRDRLPADAGVPSVNRIDPNAQGVASVVLSGEQPLAELEDFAETVLQPQFNALPGVGSATIRSSITREVHVTVDQDQLRARGLSINSVVSALQAQQLEVPAGSITRGTTDLSVYVDSLAPQVAVLGEIVVAQTTTGPVYLHDVAQVEDTYRERSQIVRVNGQEGIALSVVKLADANTITVVDGSNARWPRWTRSSRPTRTSTW